jgi:hypothetical protein
MHARKSFLLMLDKRAGRLELLYVFAQTKYQSKRRNPPDIQYFGVASRNSIRL